MSDQPPADQDNVYQPIEGELAIEEGGPLRPLGSPGYAIWMILLWAVFHLLTVVSALASRDQPPPASPEEMTINPAAMALSCVLVPLGIAAVVLTLMWIYRIHNDARLWGDYRSVSPGLALGLTFVPLFNYFWVAWCMVKLAGTYAEQRADEALSRMGSRTRVGSALAAIVQIPPTMIIIYSVYYRLSEGAALKRQNPDISRAELEEAIALPESLESGQMILTVVATLLFLWAAYTLTRDLYVWLRSGAAAAAAGAERPAPKEAGDLWPPSGRSG